MTDNNQRPQVNPGQFSGYPLALEVILESVSNYMGTRGPHMLDLKARTPWLVTNENALSSFDREYELEIEAPYKWLEGVVGPGWLADHSYRMFFYPLVEIKRGGMGNREYQAEGQRLKDFFKPGRVPAEVEFLQGDAPILAMTCYQAKHPDFITHIAPYPPAWRGERLAWGGLGITKKSDKAEIELKSISLQTFDQKDPYQYSFPLGNIEIRLKGPSMPMLEAFQKKGFIWKVVFTRSQFYQFDV